MISSTATQVRFVVSYEAGGPKLSYEPFHPFTPFTIASRANGIQFGSTDELIQALNRSGLPGAEIVVPLNCEPYAVTDEQLRVLGFSV